MTWTYDRTLPSDKDRVRLKIGDTVQIDQLFSDEEIQALLDDDKSVLEVSVELTESLVKTYARLANVKSGDTSKDAGDIYKQYKEQLASLQAESSLLSGSRSGMAVSQRGVPCALLRTLRN